VNPAPPKEVLSDGEAAGGQGGGRQRARGAASAAPSPSCSRRRAAVVVNDLGAEVDGRGASRRVADEVVDAIPHSAAEGRSSNADSVADFRGRRARIVENGGQGVRPRIDILVTTPASCADRLIST